MIYSLLGTGLVSAIAILVLMLQRNSARADRDSFSKQLDDRIKQVVTLQDAARRQDEVVANLHADIARLEGQRNALARKDPHAAGDLLAGVLASPSSNTITAPTGLHQDSSAPMEAGKLKPGS